MRVDRDRQRLDVIRIVVIRRRHPQRRLRAHPAQHAEHLVAHRGRGGRRILRIQRHHQQPVAALRRQRIDPRADRRIAVAHRPIDHDMVMVGDRLGQLFRLRARDGLQRRFVFLGVPDFQVVARFAPRAGIQDDAVQRQLPQQALIFDHPRIGQEFLEINPHAFGVGAVRRAEIDQQHADALRPRLGRGLRFSDGNDHAHDASGFARWPILVKITAAFAKVTGSGGTMTIAEWCVFASVMLVSADDRADQVAWVSKLRQCQSARSCVLRRSASRPRARRASQRHRDVSVFRRRRAAGGIS